MCVVVPDQHKFYGLSSLSALLIYQKYNELVGYEYVRMPVITVPPVRVVVVSFNWA